MTDSMIERVADILCANGVCGGDLSSAPCETARLLARAAIAAMREPTETQYEALSATGLMWRELDSKTVWQTYIDAALKEQP